MLHCINWCCIMLHCVTRVEKEVSADSKEAKSYLQSHVKSTGSDSDATLTVRPTTSFSQATLQGNIRGR